MWPDYTSNFGLSRNFSLLKGGGVHPHPFSLLQPNAHIHYPQNINFDLLLYVRYNSATNELISDEIGVAFPIQNGVPNLIPHDGRLLKKDNTTSTEPPSSKDE